MLKKFGIMAVMLLVMQALVFGTALASTTDREVEVTLTISQEFQIIFYSDEQYSNIADPATLTMSAQPTGTATDTIYFKIFANDDVRVTMHSNGFDVNGTIINPLVSYKVFGLLPSSLNEWDDTFAAGGGVGNGISEDINHVVTSGEYQGFSGSLTVNFDGATADPDDWPRLKAGDQYNDVVVVTLEAQ